MLRYVLWLALGMALGSVWVGQLTALMGWVTLLLSGLGVIAFGTALFVFKRYAVVAQKMSPNGHFAMTCGWVVLLGIQLGLTLATWQGQQWLAARVDSPQDIRLVVEVVSLPEHALSEAGDLHRSRFEVVVRAIPSAGRSGDRLVTPETAPKTVPEATHMSGSASAWLDRRLRLSWYQPEERVTPGQWLDVAVRIRPPHGFANPGGLDLSQWFLQNDWHGSGYIRQWHASALTGDVLADQASEVSLEPQSTLISARSFSRAILQWRGTIQTRFMRILGDRPYANVLLALAIGERSGIQPSQWQVVRDTGVAHLLAISGLHVGGLALVLLIIGRWLWQRSAWLCRRLAAPRAAVLLATSGAASYALLAGFTLPTQRALLMVIVAGVCVWLRRRPRLSTAFGVALFLVLLRDPLAPLSAGFWLSFGVVAALLFTMSHRLRPAPSWLGISLRVPVVAAVASVPLTAVWFGRVAVFTPLTNMLYVPIFSFVLVPLVLVSVMLLPFGDDVASVLLVTAHGLLEYLWWPLQQLAALPYATWLVADWRLADELSAAGIWGGFTVGVAVIGACWLLAPRGWPMRWMGVVCCLPLLWPVSSGLTDGQLRTHVVDVGQGLAVVLETAHHTMVYDTGARFRSGSVAADYTLLPVLHTLNITSIDTLMVSHGDSDHSGGVAALQAAFPVHRTLAGEPIELPGSEACAAGQTWQWDGVTFLVLHGGAGLSGNHASCVLRVQSSAYSVLLTGDIEREIEYALLHEDTSLQADVALIPHHGSRSSSMPAWVQTVRPKLAVAAVGYQNRWGFPKPDVVQRWQQTGAEVLDTGIWGLISVRSDGTWMSWREQRQRFWHLPLPAKQGLDEY